MELKLWRVLWLGDLCDAPRFSVKTWYKSIRSPTLGPYCKAGGEVNNVVFQGYANKAHDGFLGNSVIGEWKIWS